MELDGINKEGEVFSTYWFKRKDSSEIAEKLTYASLYKDYNWVIAMGIHLADVQSFIDAAKESSRALSDRVIYIALTAMTILFMTGVLILAAMERWYTKRSAQSVREESNKDSLTGAFNRRVGNFYLDEAFKRFRKGQPSPVLIFFDIDDFKKVNDTLGHESGDRVLKSLVEQTRQTMRSGDNLFRWGGEEFLLIADGVNPENALSLARKLNEAIIQHPIPIVKNGNETVLHVSISIGVAWFEASDESPEQALKRADLAQYRAKAEGKNCARLGLTSPA